VLKTTRVQSRASIGIGDEIRDIDSAREVGLHSGAVTFGYNSRRALEAHQPDFLFDSYDELAGAIIG
jgi:phosphoglycolate phosphatase